GSGKVINIGSVMTQLARQTIVPYSASKGGVAMLTKGMAADLARYNIQVNAISPGYFKTEMNTALVADEEFSSWVRSRTPAQRWGLPEGLVGPLVYLASRASAYVSGQNIFVDGGMTAIVCASPWWAASGPQPPTPAAASVVDPREDPHAQHRHRRQERPSHGRGPRA